MIWYECWRCLEDDNLPGDMCRTCRLGVAVQQVKDAVRAARRMRVGLREYWGWT